MNSSLHSKILVPQNSKVSKSPVSERAFFKKTNVGTKVRRQEQLLDIISNFKENKVLSKLSYILKSVSKHISRPSFICTRKKHSLHS